MIDDGLNGLRPASSKPTSPRTKLPEIPSPNQNPRRLSMDVRDQGTKPNSSFEVLSSRSYVSNGPMAKQHTYTVKEEDQEIDETEDEDNHKKNISRRLNYENNLRARQRAKI